MAKVMVSMPDEFLALLDRAARNSHRSRSELIREAIRLYVASGAGAGDPSTRRRAFERLEGMFAGVAFDPEEAVRKERRR